MKTGSSTRPLRSTVVRCVDLPSTQSEDVLRVLNTLVAEVEVLTLGVYRFITRGPSHYFGGETTFLELLASSLVELVGNTVSLGTADGLFAAFVAASQANSGIFTVLPGVSKEFLASQSIDWLEDPGLVSTLRLLGLETLGDFSSLSLKDVVARFGIKGKQAYNLAIGYEEEVIKPTVPSVDNSVAIDFEAPINQVEQAVFLVKSLSENLHEKLYQKALHCALLEIEAETEYGETLSRQWRQSGFISPKVLSAQVRWQLEGWLAQPVIKRPQGGITRLKLTPIEVHAVGGFQPKLWGGEFFVSSDHEAVKAFRRLSSLLEPASLRVPRWQGGRDLKEQVLLVPLEDEDLESTRRKSVSTSVTAPWPGQLPLPAPASVYSRNSVRAWVVDHKGEQVEVSARGALSAEPYLLRVEGQSLNNEWSEIKAWAGPWPLSERWWDNQAQRRYARFQLLTTDNVARLMVLENGHWWAEALYD